MLLAGGDPDFLVQAAALARKLQIYLNVADSIPLVHDQTRLIGPQGELLWTYRKAHPIPGLEYRVRGRLATETLGWTPKHHSITEWIARDLD